MFFANYRYTYRFFSKPATCGRGEKLGNLENYGAHCSCAVEGSGYLPDTWPHEYVLSRKDDQRELIEAVCARFRAGEGVACRFFNMRNTYLFIGDYKYWLMTHWDDVDLESCPDDYVLNRARLYRDRRDFVIQPGDTGRPEDYPVNPAR